MTLRRDRPRCDRRRRHQKGVALVELTLVLPLFALLLFGLLDIGRLVYVNNAISEGAREGARWGSVASRARTATGREDVRTRTVASMTGVPDATVTVTCERHGSTESTCPTGGMLVVRVQSRVTMLTPGIAQLVGPRDVVATARMAVSQ
jgi:Flp pilus assembly protein TadG